MNCANCSNTASHEYRLTLDTSIFYCEKHLPTFLRKAKRAGILPVTDEHKANLEEGLKNITVTPEEPAPAPEPTPEPAPTPAPKSSKKTASKNAANS